MKTKWETFKEIWKNPRYHALIELSFYIIFFAIIIIAFRTAGNSETNLSVLDKLNTMTSFDYEVNIYKNDEIKYEINGIYYETSNTFVLNDKEYEIIDGTVMLNGNKADLLVEFDLFYITHSSLYNTISEAELYSKTTYNDDTTSKTYRIYEEEKYIDIITYENDDYIYKIVIDYNDTLDNIEDYVIEIEYSNIR